MPTPPPPPQPLPQPYLFMTLFCGGDFGGARTGTWCPGTRRFCGGLGSRWGGQAQGRWQEAAVLAAAAAAAAGTSRLSLAVSPSSSLILTCPVCPPRLRPPGLGEDEATHVALEVGPRTLQRLSGCPLAASTPWGSPLHPPGVPPSAASAPAPPPCPCAPSRLSLAHSHPSFVASAAPPTRVCVCLSVCLGHL